MVEKRQFLSTAAPLLFSLMCNSAIQVFFLLALPSLGRDMGLLSIQTGIILGVAALFSVITAPIWGYLSDRFGREKFLIIGFIATVFGTIIIILIMASALIIKWPSSSLFIALLSVRLLQSIFAGGILPAAQAFMVDHSSLSTRTQAMGLLGSAFGVGAIIGAFCLFILGSKAPLLGLSLLTLLLCIGIFYFCVTIPRQCEHKNGVMFEDIIKLKRVYPTFLITFICISIFGFMQHITALRFEDSFFMTRVDALSVAGATMTGAAVVMILSQTLGVRLCNGKAIYLLFIGSLILCLALLGVTFARQTYQIIIALQFLGGALGLILPGNLALLSLLTNHNAQGKVAGFNSTAQGLGMAFGPLGGAVLYSLSHFLPNLLALVFAFFVLAIIAFKIRGLYNDSISR